MGGFSNIQDIDNFLSGKSKQQPAATAQPRQAVQNVQTVQKPKKFNSVADIDSFLGVAPQQSATPRATQQPTAAAQPQPLPPDPSGNMRWARGVDYRTKLNPQEEQKFSQWVKQNNVPFQDSQNADYDMRGYWKAQQGGDPKAKQGLNPSDGKMHFPDYWKTPYHKTFSNESIYAKPNAPHWVGSKLIDESGRVVADESLKMDAMPTVTPEIKKTFEGLGFRVETPEQLKFAEEELAKITGSLEQHKHVERVAEKGLESWGPTPGDTIGPEKAPKVFGSETLGRVFEKLGEMPTGTGKTFKQAFEDSESFVPQMDRDRNEVNDTGMLGVSEGVHQGVARSMQSLISPQNVLMMVALQGKTIPATMRLLIDAKFAKDAVTGLGQHVNHALDSLREGEGGDAASELIQTGSDAMMLFFMGKGIHQNIRDIHEANQVQKVVDRESRAQHGKTWDRLDAEQKQAVLHKFASEGMKDANLPQTMVGKILETLDRPVKRAGAKLSLGEPEARELVMPKSVRRAMERFGEMEEMPGESSAQRTQQEAGGATGMTFGEVPERYKGIDVNIEPKVERKPTTAANAHNDPLLTELDDIQSDKVEEPTEEKKPEVVNERRKDVTQRKLVEEMTPIEKGVALLTSEKTGLANHRAFKEDAIKLKESHPHVGYADMDDFKGFNTAFGHEAVDEVVLPAIGKIFQEEEFQEDGLNVYHRSGDEFLFRSKDPEAVKRIIERVNQRLQNTTFQVEQSDGTIVERKGTGLSHGTGADEKLAESAADADKQRRKELGLRTGARDVVGGAATPGQQASVDDAGRRDRNQESAIPATPTQAGGTTPATQPAASAEVTPPEILSPAEAAQKQAATTGIPRGQAGTMPVSELHFDPKRFQYKMNTDASGVTNLLRGQRFNPDLAGVVQVWRDPEDGKMYVINGHHRAQLAKESGHPDLLVRHIDVKDAASARAVGAMTNIAEGRGTAMDAAKFMRENKFTPADLERNGISMGEATAENGLALAKLDPFIFDKVVNGELTQGRGIAIGKATDNPATQEAILKMIDKAERQGRRVTDGVVAELARFASRSSEISTQEQTLFGTEQHTESTAFDKAEVSDYIQSQIKKERRLFGSVATESKAEGLSRTGNVLNVKENQRVAREASQAEEVYNKLSASRGPVDDILEQAAKRIIQGDSPAKVKADAYASVRGEIDKLVAGTEGRNLEGSPQGATGAASTSNEAVEPSLFGAMPSEAVPVVPVEPPEIKTPAERQPSLQEFSSVVNKATLDIGPEGRVGDKVFISEVYKRVKGRFPMTLEQFKQKLIQANQERLLSLSRSDMLPMYPEEKQKMAREGHIKHMDAEFHFIEQPKTKSKLEEFGTGNLPPTITAGAGPLGMIARTAIGGTRIAEAVTRLNRGWDKIADKVLQVAQMGRAHSEVEAVDPEFARKLRVKDGAPLYFRTRADAIIERVLNNPAGKLTREQEKGFVLLADKTSRDWVKENRPQLFNLWANDPKIRKALELYKPYEVEMRNAQRALGGPVIEEDYMRRVYDRYIAGIAQVKNLDDIRIGDNVRLPDEQGTGKVFDTNKQDNSITVRFRDPETGAREEKTYTLDDFKDGKVALQGKGNHNAVPFDRVMTLQKANNKQRTASAAYYFEHGLHEFGPSFATRFLATNLQLAEHALAADFMQKGTGISGNEKPQFIDYAGKRYFSPESARAIRDAHANATSRQLAVELGVDELPKPKEILTYDTYDPNEGAPTTRMLRGATEDVLGLSEKVLGGDFEDAAEMAKDAQGRAFGVQKKLQRRFLGPREVVEALRKDHHVIRNWQRSVGLSPIMGAIRQNILVTGIPHIKNILRSTMMAREFGAINPMAWVDSWKVMFDKELKAEAMKGTEDSASVNALLKHGGMSPESGIEYQHYLNLNFDKGAWKRFFDLYPAVKEAFGEPGVKGKLVTGPARIAGEALALPAHAFNAAMKKAIGKNWHDILFGVGGIDRRARISYYNRIKAEDPNITDDQIAEQTNNFFGNYNRLGWTEFQKTLSNFILFPGWTYRKVNLALRYPIRTILPAAILTAAANYVVHMAGKNRDQDKLDWKRLHFGGRSFSDTLFTESLGQHNPMLAAPLTFAEDMSQGKSSSDAFADMTSGLGSDAGVLIGEANPAVTTPILIWAGRRNMFSKEDIARRKDFSKPGTIGPLPISPAIGGQGTVDWAEFVFGRGVPQAEDIGSQTPEDWLEFVGRNVGTSNFPEKEPKKRGHSAFVMPGQ